jgi:hypothetical protein
MRENTGSAVLQLPGKGLSDIFDLYISLNEGDYGLTGTDPVRG